MPGELLAEKPQEQTGDGDGESGSTAKEAPAASKPMVGIIYPPPEVRNIVDKTADFVARNGPEFEGRIRLNEAGNTKFNFLNPHDPYHAYYRHKIVEIQEGVAQEDAAAAGQQQTGLKAPPKPPPIAMVIEPEVPKEPPPEWEFMAEPPSISAVELGIVKLTAQSVARNGAQFLDKLMMREQRNYQFDFLRKQHPLFAYFTKLVEQFSKVLLPPRNMMHKLKSDLENPFEILDHVQKRVEWEQYQARQKRKAEEEQEKQRMEYAQIDWHDFVIVETISFRESEAGYLPPPIRPTQLAQRLLQQQKYERMADEGGEVQEIEMEVEEPETGAGGEEPGMGGERQLKKGREEGTKEKEELPPPLPPPPPPPSAPPSSAASVQIRRDYNPKVAQAAPPSQPNPPSLISPITGEKIPAEKLQEHMRYGLLDPRWVEERKRQTEDKRQQEVNFASGEHIGSHLKNLAERRTDIFGVEETVIGKRIGEEIGGGGPAGGKKPPLVQWDGHSASAEAVQRQAHAGVTVEEQIEAIQRAQGLLPDKDKDRIGPILPTPSQPPLPLPTPPASQPPPMPPSTRPGPPPTMPPPSLFTPPPTPEQPLVRRNPTPLFSAPAPLPPPPGTHGMLPPPPRQMMPPGMQPHHVPMGGMPPPPPHAGLPSLPNSAPPPGPMSLGMLNQPRPPHLPPHSQAALLPVDLAPPVAKRPRADTEELVPEELFIASNPGPVTFKVQVPVVHDRPEWKLVGQVISITLPISDPVSVIKAKISDALGMPSGKQKLQIGNTFIKDSNSLGFYNITSATTVLLGLKERGGRKK